MLAQLPPPYVGAGSNAPVRPFLLHEVSLGVGLLQEKRDRMKNFLRQYDERRFLVLFNNQAGRPNPPGVSVPGGWEDGGLLSGHYAGHFLTALAQCHADAGEQVFKDKLDWMVDELAACQEAITARMDTGGGGDPEPEEPEIDRVAGRFGNVLRLNGPSNAEYVNLPQEAISQLTDFSMATWVNLASTQSWTRVFDFGQNTTVNMFLTPRAGVTGTPPRFAITVGGSGQEQRITGSAALPIDQWVHVAVTLEGTTGTLYVNGQPVGTNTAMTLNPSNLGNPGNRWIGRSQYNDPLLNATVDEFHIFDRALSPAEIQSLPESPAGTTGGGNIAWYRFDEDGGSTAADSSPNGRDAGIVAAQDGSGELWVPTHPGLPGRRPRRRRPEAGASSVCRVRQQSEHQYLGSVVRAAQDHAGPPRRLLPGRQRQGVRGSPEDGRLGTPSADRRGQEPPRVRRPAHSGRPQPHVGPLHRRRVRRRERAVR